jgi:hypothetical protein
MGGRAGEDFLKEAPPPHPHPRTLYIGEGSPKGYLPQCTEVLKGLSLCRAEHENILLKKFSLHAPLVNNNLLYQKGETTWHY